MLCTSLSTFPPANHALVKRRFWGDHSPNRSPSTDGLPVPHRDPIQTQVSRVRSSLHGSTETQACSRIEASGITYTVRRAKC